MSTTVRTASVCVTKMIEQQVKELRELFGETESGIFKVAIDRLYQQSITRQV